MNPFRMPPRSMFFLFAAGIMLATVGMPAPAQVLVSIGKNFTGSTYGVNSQELPPDANGAIGPRQFVEFINGAVAVYNKTNGLTVQRKSNLKFWADAGLIIASDWAVTDPRIIYDPLSQRWFASQVDFDTTAGDPTTENNDFLFAVSDTADPTGHWHGFQFTADPDSVSFADFPTMGVDSDAVYISGDMFSGSVPLGPSLISIPKADLTNASPIIANRTWFGVMDIADRGQVLQPATCFDGSSSGNILSLGDIGTDSDPHSNVVSFVVQNAATATAILTASTSIPVNPYVVPDNFDIGVPLFNPMQPDGTTTLQANDARFSAKVYAVGGVLYAVNNTELNGHMAVRWYRISAATHALLESGTIADPDLDLFFPSIAANQFGVVVIGCNGSSINTYVSSYAYVGATVKGVTTFGSPVLLQSGVASYHDANELLAQLLDDPVTDSRWGDYSSMSVDPADPNRFWTIQMYPSGVDSTSGLDVGIWSTQITEILTAIPVIALKVTNAVAIVSWPGTAIPFNLETSTNLTAGVWAVVPPNFSTNNGLVYYQTSLTNRARFFRLHKP